MDDPRIAEVIVSVPLSSSRSKNYPASANTEFVVVTVPAVFCFLI
jgi:hypothetical protein